MSSTCPSSMVCSAPFIAPTGYTSSPTSMPQHRSLGAWPRRAPMRRWSLGSLTVLVSLPGGWGRSRGGGSSTRRFPAVASIRPSQRPPSCPWQPRFAAPLFCGPAAAPRDGNRPSVQRHRCSLSRNRVPRSPQSVPARSGCGADAPSSIAGRPRHAIRLTSKPKPCASAVRPNALANPGPQTESPGSVPLVPATYPPAPSTGSRTGKSDEHTFAGSPPGTCRDRPGGIGDHRDSHASTFLRS